MLALSGCSSAPPPAAPADLFFSELNTLCGKSFAGHLVSNDAADAAFAGKPLIIGPVACATSGEVRVPLAVGEDRSRTWVVTRVAYGHLRLKHDHRHADGTEDPVTQYGGDAVAPGTATRQDFPVDAYSKALFARENLPRSVTNVWTIELRAGQMFAYELNRADRHFRVEFDTSRPR